MAKLVLKQVEENPQNSCGGCDVAYFEGTPTAEELEDAGAGRDGFSEPERLDNEVSKRAGLERWILSQSV